MEKIEILKKMLEQKEIILKCRRNSLAEAEIEKEMILNEIERVEQNQKEIK